MTEGGHYTSPRQGPGEYFVGTRRILVEPRAEKLVVRVGGGYNTLREFLDLSAALPSVAVHEHSSGVIQ